MKKMSHIMYNVSITCIMCLISFEEKKSRLPRTKVQKCSTNTYRLPFLGLYTNYQGHSFTKHASLSCGNPDYMRYITPVRVIAINSKVTRFLTALTRLSCTCRVNVSYFPSNTIRWCSRSWVTWATTSSLSRASLSRPHTTPFSLSDRSGLCAS